MSKMMGYRKRIPAEFSLPPFLTFFPVVLGMNPRTSCMLNKCSIKPADFSCWIAEPQVPDHSATHPAHYIEGTLFPLGLRLPSPVQYTL
jgi:hypothetical protein